MALVVGLFLGFLLLLTFAILRQSGWIAAVAQLIPLAAILGMIYRRSDNASWPVVLVFPALIAGVPAPVTNILTQQVLQQLMRSASVKLKQFRPDPRSGWISSPHAGTESGC